MIYGRTGELAEHVYLRRWRVVGWVGCEDDEPRPSHILELGSPEVGRVVHARRGSKQELRLGIVPVAVKLSAD